MTSDEHAEAALGRLLDKYTGWTDDEMYTFSEGWKACWEWVMQTHDVQSWEDIDKINALLDEEYTV